MRRYAISWLVRDCGRQAQQCNQLGPAGTGLSSTVSNFGVNLTPGADYRFIYNCRWF